MFGTRFDACTAFDAEGRVCQEVIANGISGADAPAVATLSALVFVDFGNEYFGC